MKKTNLPQEMFAVAVVADGMIYGQIYGPYNRLQDAEKAQKRAEEHSLNQYTILATDTVWRPYTR